MRSQTLHRRAPSEALTLHGSVSDLSATYHDSHIPVRHTSPRSKQLDIKIDHDHEHDDDAGEKVWTVLPLSPSPSAAAASGQPAAAGTGAPTDGPRLGEESFWSPRLRPHRRTYLIAILKMTMMLCGIVWAFVSIYWGSLYKQYDLSPNLNGWIINRDQGGIVGDTLQDALLASNEGAKPHPTWYLVDPERFPTQEDIDFEVVRRLSTFIVMEVQPNATQRLKSAQRRGDADWDPRSIVSLTYATARNAQIIPSLVLTPAQQTLNQAIVNVTSHLVVALFENPPNHIAAKVARAPQTVSSPIIVQLRDVRRFDEPLASAVLAVGLIYIMILASNLTMTNLAARQTIQPFLRFRSLILMRFAVPLAAYALITLMLSLISAPFKLDYGRAFSSSDGTGFFVWWSTTFTGMAVLGLVTESLVCLLGPQMFGLALLCFIIVNGSVCSSDILVSPEFYRIGYILPFYNLRSAYNIITFDVGQRFDIVKFHAVLWAWLVVIALTFPIWIWRERRAAINAQMKGAEGAGGGKEKPADRKQ